MRRVCLLALSLSALVAAACDRGSSDDGRIVDRAYDAYQAVADAFADTPDCAAAVKVALRQVEGRRADLDAAFELQRDAERLAAARSVLESRQSRYHAISVALDAALRRCSGTPGLDGLEAALDR